MPAFTYSVTNNYDLLWAQPRPGTPVLRLWTVCQAGFLTLTPLLKMVHARLLKNAPFLRWQGPRKRLKIRRPLLRSLAQRAATARKRANAATRSNYVLHKERIERPRGHDLMGLETRKSAHSRRSFAVARKLITLISERVSADARGPPSGSAVGCDSE